MPSNPYQQRALSQIGGFGATGLESRNAPTGAQASQARDTEIAAAEERKKKKPRSGGSSPWAMVAKAALGGIAGGLGGAASANSSNGNPFGDGF